jgi:hypothetical protein
MSSAQTSLMASQHPGLEAGLCLAGLVLLTARQLFQDPLSYKGAALTSAAAYVFTDLYLNVLHMFLDREENLTHTISFVRQLADHFQLHHGDTAFVFVENHMKDIDALVSSLTATLLLWHCVGLCLRRTLPTHLYIWTLCVFLLGELAIYNHSAMHARTHGKRISSATAALQDWGLLLSAPFHRAHHTTFTEHFAFLVGGSSVYDSLYQWSVERAGAARTYASLHILFWLVQPHVALSVAAAGWLRAGSWNPHQRTEPPLEKTKHP